MNELGWLSLVGAGFWLGFVIGGTTGFRAALITNEVNADKEAYADEHRDK